MTKWHSFSKNCPDAKRSATKCSGRWTVKTCDQVSETESQPSNNLRNHNRFGAWRQRRSFRFRPDCHIVVWVNETSSINWKASTTGCAIAHFYTHCQCYVTSYYRELVSKSRETRCHITVADFFKELCIFRKIRTGSIHQWLRKKLREDIGLIYC